MNESHKIGFAKCGIKEGEVIALVNPFDGEVRSGNIRFLPYGKKYLLNKVLKSMEGK